MSFRVFRILAVTYIGLGLIAVDSSFAAVGRRLSVSELPFQVCQILFFDAGGEYSGTCSATLLAPNYLLTAGHCFESDAGKETAVTTALSSSLSPFTLFREVSVSHRINCPNGQQTRAQSVLFNPSFAKDDIMNTDESLRRFDAALLKLEVPVSLPGMTVLGSPSELWHLLRKTSQCGVFGYGGVSADDSIFGKLKGVFVDPHDVKVQDVRPLYTVNIGGWNSGLIEPGDSGGALACIAQGGKWVLIGTTSARSLNYTSIFAPAYEQGSLLGFVSEDLVVRELESLAQAQRIEQYAEVIREELHSLEPVVDASEQSALRKLRNRSRSLQDTMGAKRLRSDIADLKRQILSGALGATARVRPFSRVYLDFTHRDETGEGAAVVGRGHLSEESNPVSTVDLKYTKFTIKEVHGNTATGTLIIHGHSSIFACRDNILCAPGTYENTRVEFDDLDFASLRFE